jgi:putative tricarboxylic transport membrane protein
VFVLTGLALFGIASAIAGFRRPPHASRETRPARRALALVALGVLLHLTLAERTGFVVASAALFWMTARAFDDQHPLRDGLFAIGLSAAAYVLFAGLLDLPLPAGLVERWL